MNQAEMERAIRSLQDQVANINANTVPIPNFAIEVNDPNIKAGSQVFGRKAGLNGGSWFFGVATVVPPTTDAHILFDVKN